MQLDATAETLKEYLSRLQEEDRVNKTSQVQTGMHRKERDTIRSKQSDVCKKRKVE